METVEQAYQFTLDKVEELREEGIVADISPSRTRGDKRLAEKYDQPDRIPPEKWVHVQFTIEDEADRMKVYNAMKYLGMAGISFDTGGFRDRRDWELDWSFCYVGESDEEWLDAVDEVEDYLSSMGTAQ